jgi:uncharacterized protein (DUF362 family)
MSISRRKFIKTGIATLSSSFLLQSCTNAEKKQLNLRTNKKLFQENGTSKIIVLQGDNFEKNLDMGFNSIGDLTTLIPKDARVVIKPNFVAAEPYPITTETQFVISLVKLLKDAGYLNIKIVDCSHISSFEYNQIIDKSKEFGVEAKFIEPNDLKFFEKVVNPSWKCFDELMVQKDILHADFIISLPVLKRHNAAGITCAMKNHMGSVSGSARYYAHGRHKIGNKSYFMNAIAEYADAVRPDLTIIDAREILIRNGPMMANGQVKKGVNKLLISSDVVALDSYCSMLMEDEDSSYSSEMIEKTLDYAEELGLGTKNIGNINIKEIAV